MLLLQKCFKIFVYYNSVLNCSLNTNLVVRGTRCKRLKARQALPPVLY
jgi:hypothetical protein